MSAMDNERPEVYRHQKVFLEHIGGDVKVLKDKKVIFPKSLEIHLGGKNKPCNLNCVHCEGRLFSKRVHQNKKATLKLIDIVKDKISIFVFSGTYSEPTLDPNFLDYIRRIKDNGANFGLHTNATLPTKFFEELLSLGDENDYISISMDACSEASFRLVKNSDGKLFKKVLENIYYIASNNKNGVKFRLTYLLNDQNIDRKDLFSCLDNLNKYSEHIGSLRFSVPYPYYGLNWHIIEAIQEQQVDPLYEKADKLIKEYLSSNNQISSKIFLLPPSTQDINKIKNITHCLFGYYQTTLGADGFFYQCNSVTSDKYKNLRLGELDEDIDLDKFMAIVARNQDLDFDPRTACFPFGCRCDRPGMEFNLLGEQL